MQVKTKPVTLHESRWSSCTKCSIGKCPSRVFFRGFTPCHLLIVGEAPGDIEWTIGLPFVGPAGRILDSLFQETFGKPGINDIYSDTGIKIAITNSVICVPVRENSTRIRTPNKTEIKNCSQRLAEFIWMTKPKVIIAAGRVAEQSVKHAYQLSDAAKPYMNIVLEMPHPASILRQEERGALEVKRSLDILSKSKTLITDQLNAVE